MDKSDWNTVIPPFAASLLELARLTVDSGWVPPQPIIFLFNGAEELFMLVRLTIHHTLPWTLILGDLESNQNCQFFTIVTILFFLM